MNEKRMRLKVALAVGLVLVLALSSLGLIVSPARAAYTPAWRAETSMGDVRAQAAVVQDANGLVYVIGGFWNPLSTASVNNVSSYNTMTGQWTALAPLPTATRAAAAAVGQDGRIYVFGGGDTTSALTQIYDPSANTWSSGANMLTAVWQARAALGYNGLIYVAGGYTSLGNIATLQIYDPVGNSWSTGTPLPTTLCAGAFVSYDSGYSLYYIGGSRVTWSDSTTGVYTYDVYYDSWSTEPSLPVAASGLAGVVGIDLMIYVFGGGASGSNMGASYNTGYYFSPDNNTWSALPNMIVSARNLGGATSPDGRILAFGGSNETLVYSQVESLQVGLTSAILSSATISKGGWTSVTFQAQFAYSTPAYSMASMYLISDSGTVYDTYGSSVPIDATMNVQVDIPAAAPPGSYRLVVSSWVYAVQNGWVYLPEKEFALTVLDTPTIEEQIASLQTDLTALQTALGATDANVTALKTQANDLQAQITALQTLVSANNASLSSQMSSALADLQEKLTALQDQIDKVKTTSNSGNMWGMVNMVLVIIVIVLLALMFVMSRKGKTPAPPAP